MQHKVVVISGASSGIGKASALKLDRAGFHVLAGVRKAADGEALEAEASSRLKAIVLDVTKESDITALRERVDNECDGELFGLVNNAGIALGGPVEFTEISEYRRQFDVNFFGHIAVTQAVFPALRKARGRIVNMSSMAGKVGQPFMAPYCASKHALEAWSDALRFETAPFGMQVAIVEPGAIATPIWDKGQSYATSLRDQLKPEASRLYGELLNAMEKVIGHSKKMAVPAEDVADAVHHALSAKRAKVRYPVGKDAKGAIFMRRVLSDRMFDKVVKRAVNL